MQTVEELTGGSVLLGLVLTNKEGLVRGVKAKGSLGCSNQEMVEFKVLCGKSKAIIRIATQDFKRAIFELFKDLLGGTPWSKALDDK